MWVHACVRVIRCTLSIHASPPARVSLVAARLGLRARVTRSYRGSVSYRGQAAVVKEIRGIPPMPAGDIPSYRNPHGARGRSNAVSSCARGLRLPGDGVAATRQQSIRWDMCCTARETGAALAFRSPCVCAFAAVFAPRLSSACIARRSLFTSLVGWLVGWLVE
jgi:hypothetical protein